MNNHKQSLYRVGLHSAFFLLLTTKALFAQIEPPPIPVSILDSYSFQSTFSSDSGYAPITETNAYVIPFWGAEALWLDTTNEIPACVQYRIVETNGFVDVDLGTGVIFLQAVPDWASADTNQLGFGPGQRGYLLAAGDFSSGSPNGLWSLYVDAGGTNICFGGVSNSVTTNYVSAPISWASNSLHEIGVYYYGTATWLALDGQWAASGGPVTIIPATNTVTNGFFLGSDNLGYEQFRGTIPYLEFDTTNVEHFFPDWLTYSWSADTNSYYTWLGGVTGGGGFHFDDDAPPAPVDGGTNGGGGALPPSPTYNTNDLYLAIAWTNSNHAVAVNLINTTNGTNYLLLAATNLLGPWVTNQSLQGAVGTNTPAYPIGILDATDLYFIAQKGPGPTNGTLKWVTNLLNPTYYIDHVGDGFDSSPAVSPLGPLYITTGGTNTFAVDPIFGDLLWTNSATDVPSSAEGEFEGSAAIGPQGKVYAGSYDGNLYSYSPMLGTNWNSLAGENVSLYSTPALGTNGLIYATSDEPNGSSSIVSGLTAFNPDGTTNWFFQPQDLYHGDGGDADGSPIIGADGTVYFLSEGYRLDALTSSGQLKWFLPVPAGDPSPGPAIAPDGSILVTWNYFYATYLCASYLHCVNPDGSVKWIYPLKDIPPKD